MGIDSSNHVDIILKQVSEGNERAFKQLFEVFHQELGSYIFRLVKSLPLAEEVVQDVFIKIWTKRDQLIHVENFRSYLFTMSRNHAYNALRQQLREETQQQKWVTFYKDEMMDEKGPDLEEYYALIDEAVLSLPPQQQKTWLLSRKEGLKHKEIALKLVLSRETVKRHISMAMDTISRYVKDNAGKIKMFFSFL